MSFKISSQESFKGQEVKLEINIPDTSKGEDHTSELSDSAIRLLGTFPFSLVLKNKTIHGDFRFKTKPGYQLNDGDYHCDASVDIILLDIKSFFMKAELILTDLSTEYQVKLEKEELSKQEIGLIRSEKYRKISNDTFCSTSTMSSYIMYYGNDKYFSIKGNITLWLPFMEDNKANCELTNFKSLICKDAFDQLDKNFKIICQGEKFHFNKTLLSMVSEVFAKMIQGPFNKEATSNSVEIIDFSPETIRTFQKFAFKNEELKGEEINIELIMFAQKYLMKALVSKCKEKLFAKVTHGNVFEIIKTSYFLDDEDIFKKASKYLKANSDELKNTDEWMSFEEANPKIMIKVYRHMI